MKWQDDLLNKYGPTLPAQVREAFLKTPRHEFIQKFSLDRDHWVTVGPQNFETWYSILYADTTLTLYQKAEKTCTISQPTLVLRMLELLDVQPGMKIFELGAGSGWNAAMLGQLVGPRGKVISFEIIPEMAELARKNTAHLPQVKIIEGDAQSGFPQESPFDRAIFTAGAYDIPPAFYEQIRDNGLLLFVLKTPNAGELLLTLRKSGHHFEEENRIHVRFVPVTGEQIPSATKKLDRLIDSNRLWIYPKNEQVVLGDRTRIEGEFSQFLF